MMSTYAMIIAIFCCFVTSCGSFFIGGNQTIESSSDAWGDLQPGDHLVATRRQIADLGSYGYYINPYGDPKITKKAIISSGSRLQVNHLELYDSGTFTSYVLYLDNDQGERVRIDMPDALFTKADLEKIGFRIVSK